MATDDCNNNVSVSSQEKQKVSVSDEIQIIPIEELKKRVPEIIRNENEDAYNPHLISISPLSQVILVKDKAPDDCNPVKQKVSVLDEIHIPLEELQKKAKPIIDYECCIYKVPEIIRRENEDAYTPHMISIGPMHYKNPKLKKMEDHKILYLFYFRTRVTGEVLEGFIKCLEDSEEEIRNCYSEKYPHLETDEFVRMILLDAVFIMEFFLKATGAQDDYIFKKPVLLNEIVRDLLLAENQLPFFVLEKLYKDLKKHFPDKNFLGLACKFFRVDSNKQKNLLRTGWDNPKHLTDLFRYFKIPRDLTIEGDGDLNVKNATKLKSAGISFKPAVEAKCLLDVHFKREKFLEWLPFLGCLPYLESVKTRLLLPKLIIDDGTECRLRNLMAFEQCHNPEEPFISRYAHLIDMLIEEENDVAVLAEGGVVVNLLGIEKELKTLINNLNKNIMFEPRCFGKISMELNKHYKNPWNKL